jgi:glycosyltransferase involved in cell wall biosynthesis
LSEFLSKRKLFYLKIASLFFKGIIAVNRQLERWANNKLNCKNVVYIPNYTSVISSVEPTTVLFGEAGKRIVTVANLRFQKNHFLLLEVAEKLKLSDPKWTFHLVGNDLNDEYSQKIKKIIIDKNLENNVFIYGTRNDTTNIINQSDITILTSDSEGLPVALIEYGLLSKPTVSTNVGEIPLIINNGENGFVVQIKDSTNFYNCLKELVDDENLRVKMGNNLYNTVYNNNSEEAVIKFYWNWINSI